MAIEKNPAWYEEAKCRDLPPATFFPGLGYSQKGITEEDLQQEVANKICYGTQDKSPCPVRKSCLEFALTTKQYFGVWGGTTENDRLNIRRRKTRKVA